MIFFKQILILSSLTIMFFATFVFASEIDDLEENIEQMDKYLTLSQYDSNSILRNSINRLHDEWIASIARAKWTEKIDPYLVVEDMLTKKTFEYFVFQRSPEILLDIGREIFDLVKLTTYGDVSGLIGKVEEISVKKGLEYVMQELTKEEIKIGSGMVTMEYIINKEEIGNIQINYLIAHKKKDDGNYETVLKIYSPKSAKMHNGEFFGKSSNILVGKDKIDPFIITIRGETKYSTFNYSWIDDPEVTIEHPDVVPDFGFQKASSLKEKIFKPIKETFKEITKFFKFFGGSVLDAFQKKDLELIHANEELKEISEDIEEVEQEIDEIIEDEDFEEEFIQEIKVDLVSEEKQEEDKLTETQLKKLLIELYKELLERKQSMAEEKELKEEIKEDKEEEKELKEEEKELKEEEKEEKIESKTLTYCSYNSQNPSRNTLIINEVAWMGTPNSSSDEWIELKNISNKSINLKGYQLLDKDNQIQIVFDDLIVAPNAYVLLERTDDDSVPNVKADLIYKGSLGNTNEALYLFNDSCTLLDLVEANSSWPFGDSSSKKSMERKPDLAWQTYEGSSFGTPKANNSEGKKVIVLSSGGSGGGGSSTTETSITYCSQEGLSLATHTPVIINEISWMGSLEAEDEWIELKNLTDADVPLLGYQLLDKDNQIKVVFTASDVIPANSFYLLERDNDDAVPLIFADKIYTGILGNTNESLRLFNSSCTLIDEVISEGAWTFGNNTLKKSMERKPDLAWQTYSGSSFGTPKAVNSDGVLSSGGSEEDDEGSGTPSITYCSQEGLSLATHTPVIINEISWMGSLEAEDEWIELKNITSESINLKGYQLMNKSEGIKILFDDLIVAPNSYVLLERTDEDSVPLVSADLIYTGAISNIDESLRLFNSSCTLIDEVVSEGAWAFGDNTLKKSMERKPDLTFQTYSGSSFGTPKAVNSADLILLQDYCRSNKGFDADGEYCYFSGGKICKLEDYYNGICTDSIYASDLIITEVSEGYSNSNREYITIFNASDEDITLCSEESCNYLAYFSKKEDGSSPDWNAPKINIPLEKKVLSKNAQYQVDLEGDNGGDIKPDLPLPSIGEFYLYKHIGAVCLFNKDVTLLTEDEAKEAKIDCVGWRSSFPGYFENNIYEYGPVSGTDFKESVYAYKRVKNEGKYISKEANYLDFSYGRATTYTVPSAKNLKFIELSDKTKVKLSYDFSDEFTFEELDFKIEYTKNSDFLEENIIEIAGEDMVVSLNHIEVIVPSIEKEVDYRFKIKISDKNGNVSMQEEPLFYTYSDMFPYRSFTFGDANRTNNIDFLGPQTGVSSRKELVTLTAYREYFLDPIVDENYNFYFIQGIDRVGANARIASYDKNGLFRWKYEFFNGYGGSLFLVDSGLYYFARDLLMKISPNGEIIFETYLRDAIGAYKYLYNDGLLYFNCLSGEEMYFCKRDLSVDGSIKTLYKSSTELSNFLIDKLGNVYFIAENNKLVKFKKDNTFEELSIPEQEYTKMAIFDNYILVSLEQKEVLIDTTSMTILKEEVREAIFNLAVPFQGGFYLFESGAGYQAILSFFDVSSKTIELISTEITRPCTNTPTIDSLGNLYYINLDSRVVGYKREGAGISEIFSERAGDYIYADTIYFNNKLYHSARESFVEISF